MKSKGLGDQIEKFTKATGIKWAVDTLSDLTGVDCGCEERKQRLNRAFPSDAPELSDEVVNEIWKFLNQRKLDTRISQEELTKIFELYKIYINKSAKWTNCNPCKFGRLRELRAYFRKN